jgi:iron complex outermembrane receptor protein
MKSPVSRDTILTFCARVAALLCLVASSTAQTPSTGTIEGRVLNAGTGEYLELARITVEGTSLETFTDSSGLYRLTNVPAGTARVKAFRTGAAEQTQPVSVTAGQTAQQDFNLTAFQSKPKVEGAIVLDEFVVASSKEMENAVLAINTQRFAPNQMNIVAADEFGGAAESKVGEVLKSLPGISMNLGGGGEPYQVSIDGVPPDNVPTTIGGFNLPSSGTGTVRAIGLHQLAINTISRIEVSYTPTPESSGAALAGSVNLVPLSAFERAKPAFDLRATISMRDEERSLHRTPGPSRDPSHKIRPGFEFTGIVPVNKRFGFTVNASAFTLYRVQNMSQSSWRGVGAVTNGNALPDTTPDKPYLTDYTVRDAGAMVTGASLGATLDFQVSRNDQLSFTFQWSFSDYALTQRLMLFFVNRVAAGNFTTTSTHGSAGAGEVRINNIVNGLGGNLYMPTLTYRHNGPIWQAEAGVAHAQSARWRKDATTGNFYNFLSRRQNVTVSFDEIFYLRPNKITVTDGATGAPIDPYKLDGYLLNTATTNAFLTTDLQQTAYANLRRSFAGSVPLTLKAGADVRRQRRDTRNSNPTLTYVGRDGIANSADDNAIAVIDRSYSQRVAPYGFPRIEWTSSQNLWDIYQANPGYFTENKATSYTQEVSLSRYAEEAVCSAYLRGDAKFLAGRLRLVGGARVEQTDVRTEGRLVDPTRNFQRDSAGKVILGANRLPLPITADALEAARLTNVDRGLHAKKEYLRWFPSLNAAFNITENLVARAGYYWSVGRPDFNQYGGSVNLPNTENPPGPNNQISINNAGIKAWTARTTKVGLDYYFEPVGLVSVNAFQRDFTNMFGQTVIRADPEFLSLYGLNPATFGDYDVSTQYNVSTPVRTTGVSLNYKQALTFLPGWARGVRVFGNVSAQRVTGDETGSFAGYTPRIANWGVSLSRPKYNLKVNWNYTGLRRLGPVAAGRGIDPGTYNWASKRLVIDVNAEYFVTRRIAVFAALSNIMDDPIDNKIYGPNTPLEARFRQRQNYGALWTFGLKGNF